MLRDSEHQIINELYQLVTSPSEFDTFFIRLGKQLESLQEAETGFAPLLAEHMNRASTLVEAITPWQSVNDKVLSDQLASSFLAAIAVNVRGDIADANTYARVRYDIQSDNNIVTLPLIPFEEEGLLDLVRQELRRHDKSNAPAQVHRFKSPNSEHSVLVTLERYSRDGDGERFAIVKTTDFGWPNHLGSIMQDLFNLTDAEISIVQMIVEGQKVEHVANVRKTSIETVRTQLRSIYAKTDTHSQSECLKLVFGMLLLFNREQSQEVASQVIVDTQTAYFPEARHRQVLTLADGKKLEYSSFGAREGKVVLFFHCQVFGDTWSAAAVNAVTRNGLRVLSPLRPGFGETTLYDGPHVCPEEYADHLRQLLDHEGIGSVSAVTMSAGLMHCLAAARLMPGRIRGISATRPQLPATRLEDLDGLSGYNYLALSTRISFLPALKFVCKAGFAYFQISGTSTFLKAFWRTNPKGVEWATSPHVLPLIDRGKWIHDKNGYLGTYGELAYPHDWSAMLAEARVPVRLVVGEEDKNLQWASIRAFTGTYPHIDLKLLPGQGYIPHHAHYNRLVQWAVADHRSEPVVALP